MATPKVPDSERERDIEQVNVALRGGAKRFPRDGFPGAVRVAAAALGIARTTFRDKIARYARDGHQPDWGIEDQINVQTPPTIRQHQDRLLADDEIRSLRAVVDDLKARLLEAAKMERFISSVESELPTAPHWAVSPKKLGSSGVPVTVWADWHFGEVVDPRQVGGINEFDIPIARARVRSLVQKIIDLCFNHTTDPNYPGIVVCLGGDMISGNIHELSETNEQPPTRQITGVYSLLVSALTTLADHFGRVFVPAVVGNHGRLHHKPRPKNRVQDNFEFLVYHFLQEHFANDPRVDLLIPEQTDALFNVAGHEFLLTHGDSTGARGGDGIIGAIGPIVRGEKRVRDVQSLVGAPYDTAIICHYHQTVFLDHVIVSPSLIGYSEFARNVLRARPERPAQWLFFVHPDQGICNERRIWLAPKMGRRDVEFVLYPEGQ